MAVFAAAEGLYFRPDMATLCASDVSSRNGVRRVGGKFFIAVILAILTAVLATSSADAQLSSDRYG